MKTIIFLIVLFCTLSCKKNNVELSNSEKYLHKKPFDDTILKKRFPNNKLEYVIIGKDSLGSDELHLSYYENGNLKVKGLQGIVSNKDINTKTDVQTWFYYDQLKKLDSTIYYNNDEFKKDYIEKKRYAKNGNLISVEYYNNYILYENEVDSIGVWKKYNDEGKLIETIEHKKKSYLK